MFSKGVLRAGSFVFAALSLAIPSAFGGLKTERVVSGLSKPVFVTQAPGDDDRLFIVEQHTGRIRIFKSSAAQLSTNAFLTVTGITTGGEQGLLGLAFDPGYETNRLFYVNYTTSGGGAAGQTQIASFQANEADLADPSSKKVLLSYNQPEANHNGGWIGFGKDGYLYIAVGDGGSGNDPHGARGNGQDRTALLGKILRIDVHQEGALFGIPDGNPFKGNATYRQEIWAFGLRNPWRCSIDRETGDLWIGDVGQSAREEIDFNPAGVGGLNFGWRPREGSIQNPAYPNENPVTPATNPIHDYGRGLGISVSGGYRYRGTAVPELKGLYIFADYGTARFWTLSGPTNPVVTEVTAQINPATPTPKPIQNVSSFGEDNRGELYICDYAGEVYRIITDTPPFELRFTGAVIVGQEISLTFHAQANRSYDVQTIDDFLPNSAWRFLRAVPATQTNGTVTVAFALEQEQQFFRLKQN